MKKIVINKCHGGFWLSNEAIKAYATLKQISLYFFKQDRGSQNRYTLISDQEAFNSSVFDVTPFKTHALPFELSLRNCDWNDLTPEQRQAYNDMYNELSFNQHDISRDDEHLIQVIESLGSKANGHCAELSIVEIPDDVDWVIQEYDGYEWVAERHRTWG